MSIVYKALDKKTHHFHIKVQDLKGVHSNIKTRLSSVCCWRMKIDVTYLERVLLYAIINKEIILRTYVSGLSKKSSSSGNLGTSWILVLSSDTRRVLSSMISVYDVITRSERKQDILLTCIDYRSADCIQ